MADFNKVMLMGRLTRDPELRYTGSGMALAKIGLAVGRRYYNKNTQETVEETTFVDCDAWGKQAELINQYLRKGSPLFIEGRLKLDTWESREGQKRSKLTVVVENFQFIDSGGGQRGDGPREGSRGQQQHQQQQEGGGGAGRGAPRVQAGNVSDGRGSSGGSGGGNAPGGSSGGGQEYDFEDIPF